MLKPFCGTLLGQYQWVERIAAVWVLHKYLILPKNANRINFTTIAQ